MIIYVPVYTNKRTYAAIDTSKAKYRHTPGYNASITYCGTIYNGDNIYSDPAGAVAYWQRDYKTEQKFKIEYPAEV